jgi:hypothetical protein
MESGSILSVSCSRSRILRSSDSQKRLRATFSMRVLELFPALPPCVPMFPAPPAPPEPVTAAELVEAICVLIDTAPVTSRDMFT